MIMKLVLKNENTKIMFRKNLKKLVAIETIYNIMDIYIQKKET